MRGWVNSKTPHIGSYFAHALHCTRSAAILHKSTVRNKKVGDRESFDYSSAGWAGCNGELGRLSLGPIPGSEEAGSATDTRLLEFISQSRLALRSEFVSRDVSTPPRLDASAALNMTSKRNCPRQATKSGAPSRPWMDSMTCRYRQLQNLFDVTLCTDLIFHRLPKFAGAHHNNPMRCCRCG